MKNKKTLICCCCGKYCMGRQWWNRDTGYGLCWTCAIDLPLGKIGLPVSPEDMRENYGEKGVHYFTSKEEGQTQFDKDFAKWLEENKNTYA